MNAKHTPGPWEAMGDIVSCGPYGKVICDVMVSYNFQPKRYVDRAESKANARLIARSPDLLAIAKKYHGWDDPLHVQAMPDCPDCLTIAQAEGRE